MSDPIKKCNNCSKAILWEKQGDKYYNYYYKNDTIRKDICPTRWEAKKNDQQEKIGKDKQRKDLDNHFELKDKPEQEIIQEAHIETPPK